MKNLFAKASFKVMEAKAKIVGILTDSRGENFVESALKILIAVVIGALLLAGLYALFGDIVMPTLKEKVTGLFNYSN